MDQTPLAQAEALQAAGRYGEAEVAYLQHAGAHPQEAAAHYRLGVVRTLQSDDKLPEAVAAYRRALELDGNYTAAWVSLGKALMRLHQPVEAAAALERAAALLPQDFNIRNMHGLALRAAGKLLPAAYALQAAVALQPGNANLLYNLGATLLEVGDNAQAEAVYRQAVRLAPGDVELRNGLAAALTRLNRVEEATVEAETAVRLNPANSEGYCCLCTALTRTARLAEAVAAGERALQLKPNDSQAHTALAIAYSSRGDVEQAIAHSQRAVELDPNFAEGEANLGMLRLLTGDFAAGWALFEARLRFGALRAVLGEGARPRWDGSDPAGKTILVRMEQGYGDAIQGVRYVPLLAARGARVLVEAPEELRELFAAPAGGAQMITKDSGPAHDMQIPLMSLPYAFGTRLESIPAEVPYLRADPVRVAAWGARLGARRGRLRVGLAWGGNPSHANDLQRSIRLAECGPLFAVAGVEWVSLQKGLQAEQLAAARLADANLRLFDAAPEMRTFADAAALLMHLDLVITVDSAPAHLAGALGREVWTLLPAAPDWRWLLGRDDSPWYPTMRLFRQSGVGDWGGVVVRVAEALARHRPSTTHLPDKK